MTEVVATGHCGRCDSGSEYFQTEDINESCPSCGEHREFSILFSESIDDAAEETFDSCPACQSDYVVETLES